jgi:DNA-binding transcriptional MerR regulator
VSSWRIEDLSRLSEVSVRNIREYQDRGLLPAPRREGRVVLYDDLHVVRLQLISRLLARGYTLATIRDLLDAWAEGRNLQDVLGLETAASAPWGDDEPALLTREHLHELFRGQLTSADVRALIAVGVLVPRGAAYRCPRRRLLEVLSTLPDAGIPASAGIQLLAEARTHLVAVADAMVALVVDTLLPEGTPAGLPQGEELARLAPAVDQLRPIADVVASGLFAAAMEQAVDRAVDLIARRALAPGAAPRPGRATGAGSGSSWP